MDAYRFQIGSFSCISFSGGGRTIDIRSTFLDVPADEMQAAVEAGGIAPDAYTFGLNILYVDSGRERVLIDTGVPPGVIPEANNLGELLQAEGIEPKSISHIIITHGHWDHIGGIADMENNLLYPNARYAMWKSEWEN